MSRSGYSDDIEDHWQHIMWRGRVASSIKGKRGQAMLRELLAALDAMPDKSLVAEVLAEDGEFCALGVLGQARGLDVADLDPEDYDAVAEAFDVAAPLVRELVFNNDECVSDDKYIEVEICGPMRDRGPHWERHERTIRVPDPTAGERRWHHMRQWVASNIKETA